MNDAITEAVNRGQEWRARPDGQVELHTSEGAVYVGRNRADIAANIGLQRALRARASRGRSALAAELLGIFCRAQCVGTLLDPEGGS